MLFQVGVLYSAKILFSGRLLSTELKFFKMLLKAYVYILQNTIVKEGTPFVDCLAAYLFANEM